LYERMKILSGYINDIGKGLDKANTSYNKAVRSMETRVLPAARRFEDLGAVSGPEIPAIEPVEATPQLLSTSELTSEEGEA